MAIFKLTLPNTEKTTNYCEVLEESDIRRKESTAVYAKDLRTLELTSELRANYNFSNLLTSDLENSKKETQRFLGVIYAGLSLYPQLWTSTSKILYDTMLAEIYEDSLNKSHQEAFIDGFFMGLNCYLPGIYESKESRPYNIGSKKITIDFTNTELKKLRNYSQMAGRRTYRFEFIPSDF